MMFLAPTVVLIQQLIETGRFHATVAAESPMPGPIKPLDEQTFLRWKSKGHHETGAETLKEAQEEATKIADAMEVPVFLRFYDEAILSDNPVFVALTPNFLNEEFYTDPKRKNPFIGVIGPDAADPAIQRE